MASPSSSRHGPAGARPPAAAGSRSLGPSAVGPPRSSHARYTAGVEQPNGGVSQRERAGDERQRFEHLADAGAPVPARRAGRTARRRRATPPPPGRRSRPSAARRRRRPTRRPARPRRDALAQRDVRPAADGAQRPAARGCRRGPTSAEVPALDHHRARRPSDERQLVGQVEAHHLGVDQVVAVVAHARDPQRDGQLGRRRGRSVGVLLAERRRQPGAGPAVRPAALVTRRRPVGPSPRPTAPRPGPRGGRPAALERLGGRPAPRQRPAQHLAALAEAGPDQAEQARRDRRRRRRRPPADAHQGRLDPGRGTNTSAAPDPPPRPRPSRRPSPTGCRRPRRPAPAASRSPASRCTITSMRSMAGTPSSRSSTSGVATL